MPYHLFVGSLMQRRTENGRMRMHYEPFLFSEKYCGTRMSYCATNQYCEGKLTVADAITMSGAAVSPYMTDNPWMNLLMTAFNMRLGQWLPNPNRSQQVSQSSGLRKVLHYVGTRLCVPPWTAFSHKRTFQDKSLYPLAPAPLVANEFFGGFIENNGQKWDLGLIADGGYSDFLGLDELLQRRCKLILVSDAACNDGKNELGALADAIRSARTKHGIQFLDLDHDRPVDIDRFRRRRDPKNGNNPRAPQRVPQHYICFRVRYPKDPNDPEDAEEGVLFYLQMSLSGLEEVDLQQFRNQYPDFPDEHTSNQFYTSHQVESYRQLGYHIGRVLCRELPPARDYHPRAVITQDWEPNRVGGSATLSEIRSLLKLGYLWECEREVAFERDDIKPESLFVDESIAGRRVVQFEPANPTGKGWYKEWFEEYERNADFRRYRRRRVYEKIQQLTFTDRGHAQPVAPRSRDAGAPTNEPAEGRIAELCIDAIACNELFGGDVLGPAGRGFQVGGRDRLIRLVTQYVEPGLEDALEVVECINGFRLPSPRAEFISSLRGSVFRSHSALAAGALLICMMPPTQRLSGKWVELAVAVCEGKEEAVAEMIRELLCNTDDGGAPPPPAGGGASVALPAKPER